MAYQTLYRKWRPMTFDEVIGQGHITRTLKNEIASDTVKHAYLFCGTRGTGKTSIAKILSRSVNCLNRQGANPCNTCENCQGILDGSILDVIEFDAASNSRVEDIRGILEEVNYSSQKTKYKVYIIDEVHMLSNSAFNALLKTLEEPPQHVIFILATTEVQKLPQTIISRCQRFDFKRISKHDLEIRFREILHKEGITCDDETLDYVCTAADGSVRDGLSILDKVIASCPGDISYDKACLALGVAPQSLKVSLTEAISKHDIGTILDIMHKVQTEGISREIFLNDMIAHFRDIIIVKESSVAGEILEYDAGYIDSLKKLSNLFHTDQLLYAIDALAEALSEAKYAKNAAALFEVALIKIARADFSNSPKALLARIAALEDEVKQKTVYTSTNTTVQIQNKVEEKLPIPEVKAEDKLPETETFSSFDLPWDDIPLPEEPVSNEMPFEKVSPLKKEPEGPKESLLEKTSDEKKDDQITSNPVLMNSEVSLSTSENAIDWPSFLAKIKNKNASLYGLLNDTKGFLGSSGNLCIVFKDDNAFLKTVVSTPGNRNTLTDLIKDILGLSVTIQTELESSLNVNIQKETPKAVKKAKMPIKTHAIDVANEERISSMVKIPKEEIPFDIELNNEKSLTVEEKIDELAKKFPDIIEKKE